jgi:hypothetical protein
MDVSVPVSVLVIAALLLQVGGLVTLWVMFVRDAAESRRVMRELEALLERNVGEGATHIRPSAS